MSNVIRPFRGCWEQKNRRYRFIKSDTQFLPAGYYVPVYEYPNWLLEKTEVAFDRRTPIKDAKTNKIIESVAKFWDSAEAYKKLGAVHKRGIFFHGPPGTGKSAAVNALCDMVVDRGGIVLMAGQHGIDHVEDLLQQVRHSDPHVSMAVVMEDIETFIRNEKEQKAVLNILSGQRQVDNVLFIGTTNLTLEQLNKICGALVNRPSRFDNVEYIGFPTDEHKTHFLNNFTSGLSEETIRYIVTNTPNCSIAHLKEIVISHCCLGEDLKKTVTRVKGMKIYAPQGQDADDFEDDPDDDDEEDQLVN